MAEHAEEWKDLFSYIVTEEQADLFAIQVHASFPAISVDQITGEIAGEGDDSRWCFYQSALDCLSGLRPTFDITEGMGDEMQFIARRVGPRSDQYVKVTASPVSTVCVVTLRLCLCIYFIYFIYLS